MDYQRITSHFLYNKEVFASLLGSLNKEEYLWKQSPEKWCLLEIVCHLYDEEREDFRTRVLYALEKPETPPPSIDPVGWLKSRDYIGQNYEEMLEKFLDERDKSVEWLRSLENVDWSSTNKHPTMGPQSAHFYLSNWLAHDYLHIKQIIRLKFDYLKHISGETLGYAGNWI